MRFKKLGILPPMSTHVIKLRAILLVHVFLKMEDAPPTVALVVVYIDH